MLPSSRLGPSIHSGTANGKFHGVMTATTPHGLRRMKASFSAISEASTSPIGMRPGAEDVLDHVQAFDHLGPALGDDLAALAGHELREPSVSRLMSWARLSKHSARRMRLRAPPGGIGGAGGGDGRLDFGRRGRREEADDFVEVARG